MSYRFLLDTNALSHALNDPFGTVARKLLESGFDRVALSAIVAGEVEFGLAKRPSPRREAIYRGFVARKPILPVDERVPEHYGRVRAHLDQRGTPIGSNDLWIAAHALAENLTLVTDNDREFTRVPGLRVENWLRA